MPFLPVGGQAVIEGVMMRSPSQMSVAVRRTDGSVATLDRPFVSITRRVKLLGCGSASLPDGLRYGLCVFVAHRQRFFHHHVHAAPGAGRYNIFVVECIGEDDDGFGFGAVKHLLYAAGNQRRV